MLLHIPHSSTKIPDNVCSTFLLSDDQLRKELLLMTDWFTDVLFDVEGVERLVYPVSRLVCDPERFSDDALESMSFKGMGMIYTKTSEGTMLRNTLSPQERQDLLERFYAPHHAALEAMVQTELNTQGFCLIIDCHSFSSKPLPHEPDQNPDRPDICIGTDPFHTPEWLLRSVEESAVSSGWRVEVNRPFSGTIVSMNAYKKDPRVFSVMLELNRSLYMNEATGERSADFVKCRNDVDAVLRSIKDRKAIMFLGV
ncbi:MAG: N-formylglutamate amidohydrolase [bacterium]|nr:N-formylglutamate amidohydrolase [bacterium]